MKLLENFQKLGRGDRIASDTFFTKLCIAFQTGSAGDTTIWWLGYTHATNKEGHTKDSVCLLCLQRQHSSSKLQSKRRIQGVIIRVILSALCYCRWKQTRIRFINQISQTHYQLGGEKIDTPVVLCSRYVHGGYRSTSKRDHRSIEAPKGPCRGMSGMMVDIIQKLAQASFLVLPPFCSDPAIGRPRHSSFLPWLSRCSSTLFAICVAVVALPLWTLQRLSCSLLVKVVLGGFRANISPSYSHEEQSHNAPGWRW